MLSKEHLVEAKTYKINIVIIKCTSRNGWIPFATKEEQNIEWGMEDKLRQNQLNKKLWLISGDCWKQAYRIQGVALIDGIFEIIFQFIECNHLKDENNLVTGM